MSEPALREIAEQLAGEHYYCEDCGHSCPKSLDECCDASQPCNCGRDKRVAAIESALREAQQSALREAADAIDAEVCWIESDDKAAAWLRARADKVEGR